MTSLKRLNTKELAKRFDQKFPKKGFISEFETRVESRKVENRMEILRTLYIDVFNVELKTGIKCMQNICICVGINICENI